ncbi:hypothetical protein [Helicobacter sp. T3_23-1056]
MIGAKKGVAKIVAEDFAKIDFAGGFFARGGFVKWFFVRGFLARGFLAKLSVVCLAFMCCGCGSFSDFNNPKKAQDFSNKTSDFVAFHPKIFSLKTQNQQMVLYLSSQRSSQNPRHITYHFALFDTLGAPLLSKKLENGRFCNTKFLPPTKRYDKLFVKLLESINTQMLKSTNAQNADFIEFVYKNIEVKELENTNE